MYLIQRIGLLLAGFVCILVMAFGLLRFAIEVGHSPLRYVVQDAAVAAAGALGLLLCWRRSRRLRAERQAQEDAADFQGQRLEAGARTGLQVFAVAVLAAISAGCLWWLLQHPDWKLALLALGFVSVTVLAAFLAASLHRDGRPALVLDGHGLEHAWYGRIPWSQVHGLQWREVKVKYNRFYSLLVGVSDPDRYFAQMPMMVRLVRGKFARSQLRHGALEIPLNPLDQPPRTVFAAARTLRGRVAPAPIPHWHPGMTDKEIALLVDMGRLTEEIPRLGPEEALRRMQAMEPRLAEARALMHAGTRAPGPAAWVMLGTVVLALLGGIAWLWLARA